MNILKPQYSSMKCFCVTVWMDQYQIVQFTSFQFNSILDPLMQLYCVGCACQKLCSTVLVKIVVILPVVDNVSTSRSVLMSYKIFIMIREHILYTVIVNEGQQIYCQLSFHQLYWLAEIFSRYTLHFFMKGCTLYLPY